MPLNIIMIIFKSANKDDATQGLHSLSISRLMLFKHPGDLPFQFLINKPFQISKAGRIHYQW